MKLDEEHGISPSHGSVNDVQVKKHQVQFKESHGAIFQCSSLTSSASVVLLPVEPLISMKKKIWGSPLGRENDNTNFFGQTFVFKASKNVSLHITPHLIKKTKKTKGPGPIWQIVPIGTKSIRYLKHSLVTIESTIVASSLYSESSSFDPTKSLENSCTSSNKGKLLEWSENFSGSGFTDQ